MMTAKEAREAIKKAKTIEVWVVYSLDDANWVRISKAEAKLLIGFCDDDMQVCFRWFKDGVEEELLIGAS
jgi:hypothetical protein